MIAVENIQGVSTQESEDSNPQNYRLLVSVAMALTLGYLVIGRAFAQIGVPAANLFLGEVIFATLVVIRPTRMAFVAAWYRLVRPNHLHVFTSTLFGFAMFGVLMAMLGVLSGNVPIEAAKNLAFNYYPLLSIAGIAVATLAPNFLDRLGRILPLATVIYILIFKFVLDDVPIAIPFSGIDTMTVGGASMVAVLLMLTRDKSPTSRWFLLGANGLGLLYLQIRGDWLAVALATAVWATVVGRWRNLGGVVVIAFTALSLISLLGISIPGAADRGGEVSVGAVFARMVAPLDEDLARQFSDESGFFAGTVEWRTIWWRNIWEQSSVNTEQLLLGSGYGFRLDALSPEVTEQANRTPHSVFFYALGYSGWIGVVAFGSFLAVTLHALIRAYRLTGDAFGVAFWVAGLASGMFGNFYETPYNAAPFWFIIGLCLAPLADHATTISDPSVVNEHLTGSTIGARS